MTKKVRSIYIAILTVVVLASVAGVSLLMLNKEAPIKRVMASNFSLEPESQDIFGIAKNSSFVIKAKGSIDKNWVKKNLLIEPEVDFTVNKLPNSSIRVSLKEEMASDDIYRFSLPQTSGLDRTYQWAFQVKAPFQVIGSTPKDKTNEVPVNTGIEIVFNRSGFESVKDMVKFEPSASFTTEEKGEVLIIKPSQSQMKADTAYFVTISKDLTVKETGEKLGKDYVIRFATKASGSTAVRQDITFVQDFNEANLQEKAVLDIYTENIEDGQKVTIDAYKFSEAKTFIDTYMDLVGKYAWADDRVNTSVLAGMAKKKSGSYELTINNRGSHRYLELPNVLGEGYYILVNKIEGNYNVTTLQATDVASYLSSTKDKSLVWLKDIKSKKSISGAKISLFGGSELGQTNSEGVALIETKGKDFEDLSDTLDTLYLSRAQDFKFFEVNYGGKIPLLIPMVWNGISGHWMPGVTTSDGKYYSYLTTDKVQYLPTDKINFWGVIKSRDGSKIGRLKAEVIQYNWTDNSETMIGRKEISLDNYGTFTSNLEIKDLMPGGSYYLYIKNDDKIVLRQYLDIQQYTKPAYSLTLTQDKKIIYSGEEVIFSAKATFFEGTPVGNLTLDYSNSDSTNPINGSVKTNASGVATFKVKPIYNKGSNYPHYLRMSISSSASEEAEIVGRSGLQVLESTIFLKDQVKNGKLEIQANDNELNSDDHIGAPRANQQVNGTVFWIEDIKTKTGEYYDPITKAMKEQFAYSVIEHKIKDFTVKTDKEGKATYNLSDLEKEKRYKIEMSATDSQGRTVKDMNYYSTAGDSYVGESGLILTDESALSGERRYKIGDKTTLKLSGQGLELPPKDQFVFIRSDSTIKSFEIQDIPSLDYEYKSEDLPNVYINGVWFDGRTFKESNLVNLVFDKNERKLDMAISFDKKKYKPREKAKISLNVKDKNGKGKKTKLNIAVTDEALKTNEGENNILDDIYNIVRSRYYSRSSHKNLFDVFDGGGGGGGDEYRFKLIDVPAYKTIETDGAGKASFEFTLPDNITSFKTLVHGVTSDLEVGQSEAFIPVGKPVFVDATLNDTYLTGDQVNLRLRTFGEKSKEGTATYDVSVRSLNIEKQVVGDKNNQAMIDLGTLPAGEHEIRIKTQIGSYNDGIMRKIVVKDSNYQIEKQYYYPLSKDLSKIKASDEGRTALLISAEDKSMMYNILKGLYFDNGKRLDQIMARRYAADSLINDFGEQLLPYDESVASYTKNGGLAILPYSDNDLELSAKAMDLGSGDLNKTDLIRYFNKSLSDQKVDKTRRTMALYGLAGLDQPLLSRLQDMAKGELTTREALFVALGLTRLGDLETARDLYIKSVASEIVKKGIYYYVDKQENEEATIKITALAAVLATRLQRYEYPNLIRFAVDNMPREDLISIERALMAKYLGDISNNGVSFNYSVGNKSKKIELEKGKIYRLSLTEEEMGKLKFNSIKGKVGLISQVMESNRPAAEQLSNSLSVTRSYSVAGKNTNVFKDGDIVKITLTPKINGNDGNIYKIVDFLPSGLKPITGISTFSKEAQFNYPTTVEGQKTTFQIYNDSINKAVVYYARVVTKGKYKAEAPFIQSMQNFAILNMGGDTVVNIN